MNKTFFKKISLISLSVTFIVALIITFCNRLHNPFLNLSMQNDDQQVAELLGDRGGSHMPDVGFSLPDDSWFVILITCIAALSLACIIIFIILKIKLNKKQLEEAKKLEQKEENNAEVKKSTSLKEIVARNLENESKEYEKIDNPKH